MRVPRSMGGSLTPTGEGVRPGVASAKVPSSTLAGGKSTDGKLSNILFGVLLDGCRRHENPDEGALRTAH